MCGLVSAEPRAARMRRLRDVAVGRDAQRFALQAAAAARKQPLLAAVDQRREAALEHAIDPVAAIIPPIHLCRLCAACRNAYAAHAICR